MTKARDLANAATALSAVDATELAFVDGVTSAIQTQIDTKLATATAATTYVANSLADAKGDLLTATADNTPARLAVGSNGDTLVADSSTSTGLRYQAIQAAGRNVLVNADFRINQRNAGLVSSSGSFVVDRFQANFSGGTCSGEQKLFSPGAGITGLASVEHYLEYISSGQSATTDFLRCRGAFEDIYTFAGETVTFSFYAKAATGTPKIALAFSQNFGSGGSTGVTTKAGEVTLSTSWARYSVTFTMPSISGKTIGANAFNTVQVFLSAGSAVDSGILSTGVQNNTFSLAAFQLEQGSVATPFTTASGSFGGELALCQRYLQTISGSSYEALGFAYGTTGSQYFIKLPVTARVAPTAITVSNVSHFTVYNTGFSGGTPTALTLNTSSIDTISINATTTASSPTLAADSPVKLQITNASGSILFTGSEM
jgi:hypothetical protein